MATMVDVLVIRTLWWANPRQRTCDDLLWTRPLRCSGRREATLTLRDHLRAVGGAIEE